MKSCHWIFLATGDLGIELLTKQTNMNLELPRNILKLLNYLSWILKDTTQIPLLPMDWWMMMVPFSSRWVLSTPCGPVNRQGMPLNSARFAMKKGPTSLGIQARSTQCCMVKKGQVRSDYPVYPSVNRNVSLSLSSDLNNYHSNILNTAENHPNLNHYNLFQNISKIFKIVENHHCSTFSTSQSP
jgi:hypothetical protein